MLVLSIDIDFFVSPPATMIEIDSVRRLPGKDHRVDSLGNVQAFLEERCLLSGGHPVRGSFMRHHVQGFDVLEALQPSAREGIELVNVDAHADLGLGDCGYVYLLTEWLRIPARERPLPRRDFNALNLGNWIAFGAAAGFLKSLGFVSQKCPPGDVPSFYLHDLTRPLDSLELRFCPVSGDDLTKKVLCALDCAPFWRAQKADVELPLKVHDRRTFQLERRPDYIFFCQSPGYTPPGADKILDLAAPYVQTDNLGLTLEPPVRHRPRRRGLRASI